APCRWGGPRRSASRPPSWWWLAPCRPGRTPAQRPAGPRPEPVRLLAARHVPDADLVEQAGGRDRPAVRRESDIADLICASLELAREALGVRRGRAGDQGQGDRCQHKRARHGNLRRVELSGATVYQRDERRWRWIAEEGRSTMDRTELVWPGK